MGNHRTKQDIIKELKSIQKTYEPSLAQVIWDGDLEQLQVMVEGISESPIIIGVKLNADMLEEIRMGVVIDPNSMPVFSNGKVSEEKRGKKLISKVFDYKFPVVFNSPSENEMVGEMTFYSSSDLVFKKVRGEIQKIGTGSK